MKVNPPLTRSRIALVSGLAALTVGTATFGQSKSWWIDIANDRDSPVRQELRRGTDPNVANEDKLPALMLAIRSGAWKVYDALLADRRIKVDAENGNGETALMYLALLGETARAQALIAKGAKVNRLGWTPLHYAASKGKADTVRMLLSKGAIVNAPAPDGTTPLMMAAYSGDRSVVQLLLDKGADPTAINLGKLTAADWARERRHTRLAEELVAIAEQTAAKREGRPVAKPVPRAAESESGGTSKYFDLDRFEKED
jgi:FOG: Ankyrin repeat